MPSIGEGGGAYVMSVMDEPDLAPSFAKSAPLKCYQVDGEGCDAEDIRLWFGRSAIEVKRRWSNEFWDGREIAGISAKRKPEWDKYAGTGVPALERIDAGWYYECTGCCTTINHDYIGTRERSHDGYEEACLDREYGPDLTRTVMEPVEPIHGRPWCSQSCFEDDIARAAKLRRYEERIHAWLARRVKRRLPDAEILPLPPVDYERYEWHAVYASRDSSYCYVQRGKRVYAKVDKVRPWMQINSWMVGGFGVCEAHLRFRWPDAKYGSASFRIFNDRFNGKPRKAEFMVAGGDREAFEAWAASQNAADV